MNQFTVIGMTVSGNRERRHDVVVFPNGMPVAVFELKNAASETADVIAHAYVLRQAARQSLRQCDCQADRAPFRQHSDCTLRQEAVR